jgi:hypothetical protein
MQIIGIGDGIGKLESIGAPKGEGELQPDSPFPSQKRNLNNTYFEACDTVHLFSMDERKTNLMQLYIYLF